MEPRPMVDHTPMTEDHEIAKRVGARIRDPGRAEREREREEFYRQLDEMSEAEVDRYIHLGEWGGNTTHMVWAQAWLREQQGKREDRALKAAEDSAMASRDSARTASTSNLISAIAIIIAIAAFVWSVWGP